MRRSIIVAVSQNGVIGVGNKLPWRLPADLKRFKQLTIGHTLIMGRKTYESIGKPLPHRTTIVLSRSLSTPEEIRPCVVTDGPAEFARSRSLEQAIDYAASIGETEVFICGGGQVYEEALRKDLVDEVYMTIVHKIFYGDTSFTLYPTSTDPSRWRLSSEERHDRSEVEMPYSFQLWKRVPRN